MKVSSLLDQPESENDQMINKSILPTQWRCVSSTGGTVKVVRLMPEESPAANFAFDVTPARLVTGLITERGICEASEEGVLGLYPEKR